MTASRAGVRLAPWGEAMAPVQQRYCPLCDRSFIPGEAVLRCEGCEVMLHPACWVRNDGCTTEGEHAREPKAIAYDRAVILFPSEPGVPAQPEPARAPARLIRPLPPPGEPVIGAGLADATRAHAPLESDYRPVPPRRYEPPGEGPGSPKKPLPKIYGRRRIAQYWYVPAAGGVAVTVAVVVIVVAEWLFGGDDSARRAVDEAVTVTGLETPTAPPAAATTPTAFETVQGLTPPAATPAGKFRPSQRVVVAGTGDCLRVRDGPGLDRAAITCLRDGTELVVQAGPQSGDGLRWWRVSSVDGEGWAAEEYLEAR